MLYLVGVLFVAGIALMGADLAGIRAAHYGGVTGTMLCLAALAVLIAKEIQVVRHDH